MLTGGVTRPNRCFLGDRNGEAFENGTVTAVVRDRTAPLCNVPTSAAVRLGTGPRPPPMSQPKGAARVGHETRRPISRGCRGS